MARLQILQYREHNDDDDSLEIRLVAPGEEPLTKAELFAASRYHDEAIEDEEDGPAPPEGPEDGPGAIYVTNDYFIEDGETITSQGGRTYRIHFTEVTNG